MKAVRLIIDLMLLAILQLGVVYLLVDKATPQVHFFATLTYLALAGLFQLIGSYIQKNGSLISQVLRTASIGLIASTSLYGILYTILWIMAWHILGHPLE